MVILTCLLLGLIATGIILSARSFPNKFGIGWLVGACTGFVACWLMYMVLQQ